jgi:hypothetical protein
VIFVGLFSFLWADKARHEVRYLEGRVTDLEVRVVMLENEITKLKGRV